MTAGKMRWLLAGACILTFGAGLGYPFLRCQDDWAYVTANEHLLAGWSHIFQLAVTPVLNLATPLAQVSYLIDYSIGGLDPHIYHGINLLWHIGMVLLVFRFFRELGIRREMAFLAALIFAIHPQRVESVVWISERKDVMCGFFFMLCCVWYLLFRRNGQKIYWWGSLAAMAAALASKPSAAALPLVLMALEFHRSRKFKWQPAAGHVLLLVLYLTIFHSLLAGAGNNFENGGFRLMLGIRNYCVYFLKTFYPAELYPLYPYITLSWADFAAVGLCLAGLGWLFYRFRQKTVYDVLPMLFCAGIVLAPVSGIMIFSNSDFADRYSYIPSVFFLGAVFLLLPQIPERFRKLAYCYPALLLIRTWCYLPSWNGDEAFLQAACSAPGSNFRGAAMYACFLAEHDHAGEGLAVLQECSQSDPRALAHREYLQILRRTLEVLARYQAGEDPRKLYPVFSELLTPEQNRKMLQALYYTSLIPFQTAHANCALAAGKPETAAEIYESLAGSFQGEPFTAPFYMGVAQMLRRDAAGAILFFEQAVAASPEDRQARTNLENARRLAAGKRP